MNDEQIKHLVDVFFPFDEWVFVTIKEKLPKYQSSPTSDTSSPEKGKNLN